MSSKYRREECVENFLNGKPDRTPLRRGHRHLITDGTTLWCYGTHYVAAEKTGIMIGDREAIFVNQKFYSITTSKLMGLVCRAISGASDRYVSVLFEGSTEPSNVIDTYLSGFKKTFKLGVLSILKKNTLRMFETLFPDFDVKGYLGDTLDVNYSSLLEIQKNVKNIAEAQWEANKLLSIRDASSFRHEAPKLNIHMTRMYIKLGGTSGVRQDFRSKDIVTHLLKTERDPEYALLHLGSGDWEIEQMAKEILEGRR